MSAGLGLHATRRRALGRGVRAAAGIVACAFALGARADDAQEFARAMRTDDGRLAASLLERGADPNAADVDGQVPLFLALRDGAPRVALALLASPRLAVDAANRAGETALMIAALRAEADFVRRLLERGAQINREGWTPLHYAASGPGVEVVALLLDRGAAVEARSPNRTTPLMMAAGYGAIDAADLLLRRGADPKARNDAGLTAAEFAARVGRDALQRRLEQAAAR
ncbi:MAG: ankyrin repeat domain-containing protein [Pseudomonadota bacterium]|nr:ankyrin repeat domain-containing protein [Burkholderiales bacterium]MCA3251260.1 ankyrin repeat domain-containing protein [Rubrivivax sp.]MCA3259479.1 ankyrin repeat domain-containing protein [Rubrivivax sp.]MCE2910681.1 ankyrin repeat domain-containing protein [Rubrivivax sp.]MCZ8030924.1 ankyrin repeat domain-containing protein [Rubrivivax sp.]